MGGFPGLNLPQQIPAPQGVQGGVVGTNPTGIYRDPKADQIVKGLSQLVQGVVSSKQAVEQHYGQKLDDLAQRAAAGLITPDQIDWKQVSRWMKGSNRGYVTDQTPAEQQNSQVLAQQAKFQDTLSQAQQGAQQLASQSSGMPALPPGPMGSPGQPGMGAPGVVAPPTPPAGAPPGFMDRLRMMAGMAPVNQNVAVPSQFSPAVQSMQALARAGQTAGGAPGQIARGMQDSVLASNVQRAAGKLGIAHNESMIPVYQDILHKALGGDLDSMTMLRRMEIFKGVPIDEAASLYKAERPGASDTEANASAAKLLLWQQGGGPQLQLRIADMAKDMIPRFGGDAAKAMQYVMGMYTGQQTGLQPGRTPEEFQKFAEGAGKVAERYPAAPQGLVDMYANAKVGGNDKLADTVLDFLSGHYKTGGQISQSQFQQTLSKDYSQIASQNQVGNREADASDLRSHTQAFEQLSELDKAILTNPKAHDLYTQDQINKAMGDWQDKGNSLAGRALMPLSTILDRNNVDTRNVPWGMGPFFQRNVLPSPAPAPGGQARPKSGKDLMTPQDYQLLGLPMPTGGGASTGDALQQLLMGRAGAR